MTREEAINKVRQMSLPKETMEILEALAPELKESEDERIRRWLCDYFSSIDKAWIHKDITCIDILRWLKKQKDLDKMIVVSPEVWDNAITDAYENGKRDSEKQKEQKPVDYETELKKCKDNPLYFYDKYVSIKQKPAEWSEEDEEILKLLILNIGRYMYFGGMSSERILSFLKSLRPQYHGDVTMTEAYKMGLEAGKASSWKPSEEDLMMLEHIIGQYEIGNKNSKVMGYLPRIEELDFLKKVLAKWKN